MSDTVVVAAVRTPIGKLGGNLSTLAATTLGGEAIRVAVERSRIAADRIEHAIMGQVIQAGAGQADFGSRHARAEQRRPVGRQRD